jgi:hypothetical protein
VNVSAGVSDGRFTAVVGGAAGHTLEPGMQVITDVRIASK